MPRLTPKKSIWFDWLDDPDGARVEIENITDQDTDRIKKASITSRSYFDFSSGLPVRETVIDQQKDRQETACSMVKNWENFFNEAGDAMECEKKNIRLWACNDAFMVFIKECQQKVQDIVKKDEEERRKNS